jgi:hypothetical protein
MCDPAARALGTALGRSDAGAGGTAGGAGVGCAGVVIIDDAGMTGTWEGGGEEGGPDPGMGGGPVMTPENDGRLCELGGGGGGGGCGGGLAIPGSVGGDMGRVDGGGPCCTICGVGPPRSMTNGVVGVGTTPPKVRATGLVLPLAGVSPDRAGGGFASAGRDGGTASTFSVMIGDSVTAVIEESGGRAGDTFSWLTGSPSSTLAQDYDLSLRTQIQRHHR